MTSTAPERTPVAVPFAADLGRHADRVALVAGDDAITYRDLADRVDAVARDLGPRRRLVQVAMANRLEPVVTYLGALAGGHVVLVSNEHPARAAALTSAYDPDVVAGPQHRGGWELDERRSGTAHDLHPDLALLLSTSGSTGAAKVVRLSHENLRANAASIAEYLRLRDTDRAITSLPLHYCYGLSVLHSHLAVGAGVILSDRSVVDCCFWDAARAHGATSLAGVPHTFEMLERVGVEALSLPTLRYVTQAGGRMDPDRVRRFAELGRRQGWDLYVMYGQTEATARMAYLPPALAASHPEAIGIPIPGGQIDLAPLDGDEHHADDVGELVYRGANVMLGYAESPADLALGATTSGLRTGDLARRTPEGLYEVVGRRSRFVKPFGVRVDLDAIERLLARHGIDAVCAGDDDGILVAAATSEDVAEAGRILPGHLGLPPSHLSVQEVPDVPRLASGKPDHLALIELVRRQRHEDGGGTPSAEATVAALVEDVLQRPVDDRATFVELGGDSLCYVEMSLRLEALLGHLPPDWHTTPIRDLRPVRVPARRRLVQRVETGVVVRAAAIVMIVGTHAGLFRLQGGAHVLLALAGANFARFQLRSGHILRSALRVAVPSMVWLLALMLVSDAYDLSNVLLIHGHVGDAAWSAPWRYWFIEVLVQILLVAAVAFSVPAVRRLERAAPFLLPLGVLAVGLVLRFDVLGFDPARPGARPQTLLWLFALGWAADRATSWPRRALVSALVLAAVPGFFDQPTREATIIAGLLLLVWVPAVPMARGLGRALGVVASASLCIYLTHWQVYPPLLDHGATPLVAVAASIVVGIGAWWVVQRATAAVEARWGVHRADPPHVLATSD